MTVYIRFCFWSAALFLVLCSCANSQEMPVLYSLPNITEPDVRQPTEKGALWKGQNANCAVFNIAHRGASSIAPENTLAAANKAWNLQADAWELDVQVSQDGEPFLSHNKDLSLLSNIKEVYPHRRSWYAYEYDWGEIEQLDFGSWFVKRDPHHQFKRGHISKEEMAEYSGERTLSLQQALAFTYQKQWRVLIEIKNLTATPGHTTVVPKVIEYIRRFDMVERAMIISFEESYLQQVKALEPSIATGFITYHKNKNHFDFAKKLNVQAYIASTGVFEHDEFHKKHLPSLRQAGILTYVWTVNDANQMSKFIQLGVDGIITDFPQRLTNLLRTC